MNEKELLTESLVHVKKRFQASGIDVGDVYHRVWFGAPELMGTKYRCSVTGEIVMNNRVLFLEQIVIDDKYGVGHMIEAEYDIVRKLLFSVIGYGISFSRKILLEQTENL